MTAQLQEVKKVWSNIEVTTTTGQYHEALQFRLLLRLWYDDALRQEFIGDTKRVLAREAQLELPSNMQVKVVEDNANLFHFILPRKPPQEEFNYRFQQIADWWMVGHYLCYRQLRDGKDLAAVDKFRQGLHVMIIGRTWFDPDFKQAMIRDAKTTLANEIEATFPPALEVKAPEDTDGVTYLVIPQRPQDQQLLDQSEHLAGWFAAGHNFWYFLNTGRLLRPLPQKEEDKILS